MAGIFISFSVKKLYISVKKLCYSVEKLCFSVIFTYPELEAIRKKSECER